MHYNITVYTLYSSTYIT